MSRTPQQDLEAFLVNFTVTNVAVSPDGGVRITAQQGSTIRDLDVFAGSFGLVVELQREKIGDGPIVYSDVGHMFQDIQKHVLGALTKGLPEVIVARDDPQNLRFCFSCPHTGTEWGVKLATVSRSVFRMKFQTSESRAQLAKSLMRREFVGDE